MKLNVAERTRYALVVLLFGACVALAGCGLPPQLGDNRDNMKATDALNTAIGTRDSKLLDQCAERLQGLNTARTLSAEAYEYLQDVIEQARGGDWDSARDDLKHFMKGQHRAA